MTPRATLALLLTGLACLVISGFLVHPALGFACLGLALLLCATADHTLNN